MQVLLPTHPEKQKEKVLREYEDKFAKASAKFSDKIKQRTINLMKHVSSIIIYHYSYTLLQDTCIYKYFAYV